MAAESNLQRLLSVLDNHFAEEFGYFAETCVAIASKGKYGKLYPGPDLGPPISAAFGNGATFRALTVSLPTLAESQRDTLLAALAANPCSIKATIAAAVYDVIHGGGYTLHTSNYSLFQVLSLAASGAPVATLTSVLDARVMGAVADLKMHNDAMTRATNVMQQETLARNLLSGLTGDRKGV